MIRLASAFAILLAGCVALAGCAPATDLKGFKIHDPRVVVVHKEILAGIPVTVEHTPKLFHALGDLQYWLLFANPHTGAAEWVTRAAKHWTIHDLAKPGHEKELNWKPVACRAGLWRMVITVTAVDYQGKKAGPETFIWPAGSAKNHRKGYRIRAKACK